MTDTELSDARRLAEQVGDLARRFRTPSHERGVCNGANQSLRVLASEVERLRAEVHNLNWALGTPGYDQMATPEEQAESDAAVARTNDFIARIAENKEKHDAMVKDAAAWRAMTEAMVDEYLEDYEMVGEDADGRDACYQPTEGERALIKDAVMGLFAAAEEAARTA